LRKDTARNGRLRVASGSAQQRVTSSWRSTVCAECRAASTRGCPPCLRAQHVGLGLAAFPFPKKGKMRPETFQKKYSSLPADRRAGRLLEARIQSHVRRRGVHRQTDVAQTSPRARVGGSRTRLMIFPYKEKQAGR
jgi:hypothetical protein